VNSLHTELESFIRHPTRGPQGIAAMAKAAQILPVLFDWTLCGGLLLDGEPVWVDYDPPYLTSPVVSTNDRNTILHLAAVRYPSLKELEPHRPTGAITCFQCNGTGVVLVEGKEQTHALCICAGLGWLAEDPRSRA